MLESIESALSASAYRPFVVEYGRPAGIARAVDTTAASSAERQERFSRLPRPEKNIILEPVSYGSDASVQLEEAYPLFELYA